MKKLTAIITITGMVLMLIALALGSIFPGNTTPMLATYLASIACWVVALIIDIKR